MTLHVFTAKRLQREFSDMEPLSGPELLTSILVTDRGCLLVRKEHYTIE